MMRERGVFKKTYVFLHFYFSLVGDVVSGAGGIHVYSNINNMVSFAWLSFCYTRRLVEYSYPNHSIHYLIKVPVVIALPSFWVGLAESSSSIWCSLIGTSMKVTESFPPVDVIHAGGAAGAASWNIRNSDKVYRRWSACCLLHTFLPLAPVCTLINRDPPPLHFPPNGDVVVKHPSWGQAHTAVAP